MSEARTVPEAQGAQEVHVAVGVVIRNGRVLIARRPEHAHQGGLLEFPGGKVEPGETVQQALVREMYEETGLQLIANDLQPVIGIHHDYGDKRVFLDVWTTTSAAGQAESREGQPVQWLLPDELQDTDFPEANRPVIRALQLPSQLALTGAIDLEGGVGLRRLQQSFKASPQPMIVLRVPDAAHCNEHYDTLVRGAVALCHGAGSRLMLHGAPELLQRYPQVAGVHMPWREAGKITQRPQGTGYWLGVSCHNADQLAHAAEIGADYATLGHVMETLSHPGEPALGWDRFRRLVAAARLPVYAIGGVAPNDVLPARQLGAQGIAGIRFWWI